MKNCCNSYGRKKTVRERLAGFIKATRSEKKRIVGLSVKSLIINAMTKNEITKNKTFKMHPLQKMYFKSLVLTPVNQSRKRE